jgi:hypothetical protein
LAVVVQIGAAGRESSGAQRRPTAEQQRNEFDHFHQVNDEDAIARPVD